MDNSLVEGSLFHLKMDSSRRRCSLIHLRRAAVQWQILILSPSGCPEPDSVCKAAWARRADCLAASSLSRSWCVKASTSCNRADPLPGGHCLRRRSLDNSSNLEFVKSEAQKYLETGFAVTFISGKDILDFWRMHEKEYPHLAKLARQFLGCLASSASVERIFSVQ